MTQDEEMISDYMAAVYGCIGQLAFQEDGREWNCDAFKIAKEHPIHEHPELLAKANEMLQVTVGQERRGKAALARLANMV